MKLRIPHLTVPGLRKTLASAAILAALLVVGDTQAAAATVRAIAVTAGYGAAMETGLTLAASITSGTTLSVTDGVALTNDDYRLLKVGMTLYIDDEQMKVTGLLSSPPAQPVVTVLRGQAGTGIVSHSPGATINGNFIKVPVTVTGVAYRPAGTVAGAGVGSQTTQLSGTQLLRSVAASCTTLPPPLVGCKSVLDVSDQSNLIAGSTITINSEQMAASALVDSTGDGFTGAEETLLGGGAVGKTTLSSMPESPLNPGSCSDGVDNDLDTFTDTGDPGCNTSDTDGDGFTAVVETAMGSSATNAASRPEGRLFAGTCSDSLDNDLDSFVDGADSGCDAIDGDLDGYSGGYEKALGSIPGNVSNTPESVLVGGSCTDTVGEPPVAVDNDGDGLANAADPGCNAADGDGDGVANVVEVALGSDPANILKKPEHAVLSDTCDDGVDNDGDGSFDAADSGCDNLDVDADTLTVLRAQNGTSIATHSPLTPLSENIIDLPVFDGSLLGVSSTISVDSEKMVVKRARTGSPDILEVLRGVSGTAAAAHVNGASITDIDGAGSFDLTVSINRSKVDFVRIELDANGGFLGSTGRATACESNIGPYQDSGATLDSPITSAATTFNVPDQGIFRIGGTVMIDAEEMVVKGLADGTPDTVTVYRAVLPPATGHDAGAQILGQNLTSSSARIVCLTTGSSPLGPIGGSASAYPAGLGTSLARIVLMPVATTYAPSPAVTQALSNVALLDVSGDQLPVAPGNGSLLILRCPDANNDKVADIGDLLAINRAVYRGAPTFPPDPAKHDVNGDGFVDNGDSLNASRIVYLSDSAVYCRTP